VARILAKVHDDVHPGEQGDMNLPLPVLLRKNLEHFLESGQFLLQKGFIIWRHERS
jgi:hypothetical protein